LTKIFLIYTSLNHIIIFQRLFLIYAPVNRIGILERQFDDDLAFIVHKTRLSEYIRSFIAYGGKHGESYVFRESETIFHTKQKQISFIGHESLKATIVYPLEENSLVNY
jgi:hypothetical protein